VTSITHLIAELEELLKEKGDVEVFVELKVSNDQTWFGCLIEGTGQDEEGCVVIRAVTP